MANAIMYEVSGCVTRPYEGGMTLVTPEGVTYRCECPYFKPVHEGDTIQGVVKFEGKNLRFTTEPWVEVPTDEYNLEQAFIRALYGTGFGKVGAKKLYEGLGEVARLEGRSVERYLSHIAVTYLESRDPTYPNLLAAVGSVTERQAVQLLRWWDKSFVRRRLYLCGLTNQMIEACQIRRDALYPALLADPYRFGPVPLDLCQRLLASQGLEPSAIQLACGTLIRKIYEVNEKSGWTAAPLWLLARTNPQVHALRSALEEEGVHFDLGAAYLDYPYTVETTVATYLNRLIVETAEGFETTLELKDPRPELSADQQAAVAAALHHPLAIITGGAGTGKCLNPLTPVLMFNGQARRVKDLRVGDLLMGDDSKPRRILSMTKGQGPMYRIRPEVGLAFECNLPHILTLEGLRSEVIETAEGYRVTYSERGVKKTQFFEGLTSEAVIPRDVFDIALADYLALPPETQANLHLFHVGVDFPEIKVPIDPYTVGKEFGLNDWIPSDYRLNSRAIRLRLLDGIVDTYGKRLGNYIEIPLQDTKGTDILTLALSLGMLAWIEDDRIIIETSGETRQRFEVEALGPGPYAGFELDGNGRFLLGDYTVTHNTTVIGEIVRRLKAQGVKPLVGSFTGKAVSRLQEVLGERSAVTLDRAISRGVEPFDHLIIDEVSMVTTELFYRFISKFKGKYKITLVGDLNQLQPIGWGSFLRQIVNANRVPIYRLTENHRLLLDPGEGPTILENANALIAPDRDFNVPVTFKTDLTFSLLEGGLETVDLLVKALHDGGVPSSDLVIICPYTEPLKLLNEAVQKVYLPEAESCLDPCGITWRLGDRVMMLSNNYQINVMNGEEGDVVGLDALGVTVQFHDGLGHTFRYASKVPKRNPEPDDELTTQDLQHSFAVTIHKAQGSESRYVIVYIPYRQTSSSFINVNLLYTALTRARKALWLVGSPGAILQATSQVQGKRVEYLASRLLSLAQPEKEARIVEHNQIGPVRVEDEAPPEHEDLSVYA